MKLTILRSVTTLLHYYITHFILFGNAFVLFYTRNQEMKCNFWRN